MKLNLSVLLLFFICGYGATASAQSHRAEIRQLVRGISGTNTPNVCAGHFEVNDKGFQDPIQLFEVAFVVDGSVAYRQLFRSSLMDETVDGVVEFTPIQIGRCSGLFATYTEGMSGESIHNSFVVYAGPYGFKYKEVANGSDAGFGPEDLDGDGEAELIEQKVDENADPPCNHFAYWGRVYHLDRRTGQLVEQNGARYPKYYASLAEHYRSILEDRMPITSDTCRATFKSLLAKAEMLSGAAK